jgi:8-oxo-dGTP diphosphatase
MKKSHQAVYDLIASIQPLDQIEKEHITFALNWIKHSPQIFRIEKPAIPEIHLVSYFVLIDQERIQLLLVDHKKSGLWLPAGGHVELDEHPAETVKREAQEELGINVDFLIDYPFFLTATKTIGAFQHTDVSLWYLLHGKSKNHLNYDVQEFHRVGWFKIEEIPFANSDPHMQRFIDKLNKFLTLNSYDASANQYKKNTESLHPHIEAKQFIEKLPEQATILDIGCGPGRDAKIFQELGFEVTAIDFSAKMIELARKEACKAKFHLVDIEKLEFPKETFDGAWASASFLHIPKKNMPSVFKNIHALLKAGGIFYCSVKRGSGEMLQSDARYGNRQKFWSFFEEQELSNLLTEAQFEVLDSAITEKRSSYETHPMIRVLCKKRKES